MLKLNKPKAKRVKTSKHKIHKKIQQERWLDSPKSLTMLFKKIGIMTIVALILFTSLRIIDGKDHRLGWIGWNKGLFFTKIVN